MSLRAPGVRIRRRTEPAHARPRRDRRSDEQSRKAAPRLLAELSHDLRSPLTSLRLLVEGMTDGVLDEAQRREWLAGMQTQISLLTAMVDDLHSLSRAHAGDRPDLREAIDPSELVTRAVEAMRIQAQAREITLACEVAAGLPVICGDALELHRVLVNLVENAIRHSSPGGEVLARARPLPGGLEIEVEDGGDGIPPADRERVFQAFYGHDRSRSRTRSGLGLAIARATVEAHDGCISVADSTRGARIRIWLPAAGPRRLQPPRARKSGQSCNDLISVMPGRLEPGVGTCSNQLD